MSKAKIWEQAEALERGDTFTKNGDTCTITQVYEDSGLCYEWPAASNEEYFLSFYPQNVDEEQLWEGVEVTA